MRLRFMARWMRILHQIPKESLPNKIKADLTPLMESPETGYTITRGPSRSLAQIHLIQAEMPKGEFTAPPNDWRYLTKTHELLSGGKRLRIMAVGDSIIADTMRSSWGERLMEVYPGSTVEVITYVRGGGGCQHYHVENRVEKNIIPNHPDLVFMGGISQRDPQAIRDVLHELRAKLPGVEILLGSGCFGKIDPRYPADWITAKNNGGEEYRNELARIAREEKCAYLDFTPPWGEYVRASGLHPHLFYRDPVHANEFGEQILSKILIAFFTQPVPASSGSK
ncbi:MAG: SGNH/GDSL hydrolase family protein [Lacunisphaera sp.]